MNTFISLNKKIKYIVISIIVLSIIIFFACARTIGPTIPHYTFVSYSVYMLMLSLWFYSIKNRIIEKDVRYYIYYICLLMMFLFTLRTIKWSLENYKLEQILWYMYYIPFILMPLFLTFIAIYIDKNLYQKLLKKLHLLLSFSIILILFVLTNNLHEQVFKIIIWTASYDKVEYKWGYYIVFTYLGVISLNTMYFIIKNSKLPNTNKRIILPIAIIILHIIYIIFYIKTQSKFGLGAIETTVMVSLTLITIIESLILTGLIPANSNYKEIFKNLDMPILITDDNYNIHFKSKNNLALKENEYYEIKDDKILIKANNKFSAKSIHNGHILWSDDISAINKKTAEITSINQKLLIKNELLKEQILLEKEEISLKQQNNIYEQIENSTRKKINQINMIIKDNDNVNREHLIKICLIGSYIKRISNIILINELYGTVNVFELQNAILESISNYSLKNTVRHTEEYIDNISIKGDIAKKVYEYFESELEFYFDKNAKLNVNWSIYNDCFKLITRFTCYDATISNNILDFADYFNKNNIIYKKYKTANFYEIELLIEKAKDV